MKRRLVGLGQAQRMSERPDVRLGQPRLGERPQDLMVRRGQASRTVRSPRVVGVLAVVPRDEPMGTGHLVRDPGDAASSVGSGACTPGDLGAKHPVPPKAGPVRRSDLDFRAISRPQRVEGALVVDPAVGVRAEVVAQALDERGREPLRPDGVVVREGAREAGHGHPGRCGCRNDRRHDSWRSARRACMLGATRRRASGPAAYSSLIRSRGAPG